MNYWWEADGFPDEFTDPRTSSSELVRDHLPASRDRQGAATTWGTHDLEDEARPLGRRPVARPSASAGDDADDVAVVARTRRQLSASTP